MYTYRHVILISTDGKSSHIFQILSFSCLLWVFSCVMNLYRNAVRYQFTHEILPSELSVWKENNVERKRRVSVILRCEPEPAGT